MGLIIVSSAGAGTRPVESEPQSDTAPSVPHSTSRWGPIVAGVMSGLVTAGVIAVVILALTSPMFGGADWAQVAIWIFSGAFGLATGLAVARRQSPLPVFAMLGLCVAGSVVELFSVFAIMPAYPIVAIVVGMAIIALAVKIARSNPA